MCAVEACQRTVLWDGFLLHSANFGFAIWRPRSPSAPPSEHCSMENTLRNNRYSACLLYGNDLFQQDMSAYSGFVDFHEIFETLRWKFWCEKSADFQGMEGRDARKSVTKAKNLQTLFQNRKNMTKRRLPWSDDFINGILTRRCTIMEIICIKYCLRYRISTR